MKPNGDSRYRWSFGARRANSETGQIGGPVVAFRQRTRRNVARIGLVGRAGPNSETPTGNIQLGGELWQNNR
jgi:hypothetical protein